jgi:peptide deformylase
MLSLIHQNHPCLHMAAAPIQSDDWASGYVHAVATDMLELCRKMNGVAIAAPQVGISLRLVVIDMERYPELDPLHWLMVNPVISYASIETVDADEGCLSYPGEQLCVSRSLRVNVRYENELNPDAETRAYGLGARVIQHEVDHLRGLTFHRHASAKRFHSARPAL